jgi:hypothetical protein
MKAEDHWAKAARIEASRTRKLDRAEDYELIIWSCIHGGAHLVNAVMHRLGLTPDNKDYIHSDKIEDGVKLPDSVVQMLDTLHSIELHGPRFVRGPEPLDPKAVETCLDLYGRLKTSTQTVLFK